MIDKIYIDRAISLRKEYLELNGNLKKYEHLIINLKDKVESTIGNLQDIVDNIKESSVEDIQKNSMKFLANLEEETQKIQKFVDPINKKLETLQKEEQALYNQIKLKYPTLDNKEILSCIQDELKKKNLS
jgi:predicted  nucleic acid-binding Zn-ribbon protein